MDIQPLAKMQATAALLLAAATIVFAGCSGGSSSLAGGCGGVYGGAGNCMHTPIPTTTPTIAPATAPVGILLSGESPVTTTSFSTVLGYSNGTHPSMPNGSGVVTLTANTNVQFVNLESGLPHTASSLGPWTGSYPAAGPTNLTPTAAGHPISESGFSTGNLNPGASSSVYNSGAAGGMYVFGCVYHYSAFGMRTVIIVQ